MEMNSVEEIMKRTRDLTSVTLYKNEEEFIKKTIDHIYPHVDNIILCDDNSNDNSYTICKSHDDPDRKILNLKLPKVISDTWNIADKKNFMLAFVDTWWTLVLDADEHIEDAFYKELLNMMADKNYDVYGIPRKNYIDGEWIKTREDIIGVLSSTYPDYQLRLFRSRCRYCGSVHEELTGYMHERRLYLNKNGPHIIHDKTSQRQKLQDKRYDELARRKIHFVKPKFMEKIPDESNIKKYSLGTDSPKGVD